MTFWQWTALVLLSVVWGGSFYFVELALVAYDVWSIVFLRVTLAAMLLLGLSVVLKQSLPNSVHMWYQLSVLACLNNVVPFCLIVWGN